MTRDSRDQVTSRRHFNADGSEGEDGQFEVFELRWEYDALGNEIGEACFYIDGSPVKCARTGYHRKTVSYDDAGRELDERYFETDGSPGTNVGTTVHRSRYDNYDHLFETRGYDDKGKLIETMGSATRRELYDATHRRFGVIMLDRLDRASAYTGCYMGVTCPSGLAWHACRLVLRTDGSVAKNQYFDIAGQLIHTVDCTDERCFE